MDAAILLAVMFALGDPSESNVAARVDDLDAAISHPEPSQTAESSTVLPEAARRSESEFAREDSTQIAPSTGVDENQPVQRATSPATGDAPVRRSGSIAKSDSIWPGLLALAGVLGLIGLLTLLVRRLAPRVGHMSAGHIEVVGRSFVSAKQSVALVRVGDRIVVVGICPESMSQLLVIDDPVEVGRLSVRSKGGSAAFDRLVQGEARSYGDEPRSMEAPSPSGINQLLARVKARVQQI